MATIGQDVQVGTPFSRAIAVIGIVAGFIAMIVLGAIALYNYNGWKLGRDKYPIAAWVVGCIAIIGVTGVLTTLLIGGTALMNRTGETGGRSSWLSEHHSRPTGHGCTTARTQSI